MKKNSNTYLFTGGGRSGKSRYALELAGASKSPFFIATGWNGDDEMKKRIFRHRAERGNKWTTIEEQIKITDAVNSANSNGADFIIVDCIGSWITNLMVKENLTDITNHKEVLNFIEAIPNCSVPLVIVTNEVGMGIIPNDTMTRAFRDNLGFVNQKIAGVVSHVILMVCGLPMEMK